MTHVGGAVLLGFMAVAAAAKAAAVVPSDLLPDLTTLEPHDLRIQHKGDQRRVQLTNAVANRGAGPLEVYTRGAGGDCDGNGEPGDDRVAFQRVFGDSNSDGRFHRRSDKEARTKRVGCMVFHPKHDHWHLDRFAAYKLRPAGGDRFVARNRKVSFCLRDTIRSFPGAAGSPAKPRYGECSSTSVQGISIGWSDVYRFDLPDQYIDVTGLPSGRYCLVSRADPANRLDEAQESNNRRRVGIRLRPNSVRRSPRACTAGREPNA